MITTEIYIEGKRVDITQDVDALITYTIDDVKDFSARNTTFSKTIKLPGTSNNDYIFGHIFNINISNPYDPDISNVGVNYNVAKGARCLIFRNHVQVFKGVLRLLEVVINSGVPEYETAVFGELGGLILKLGSNRLQDLNFSAHDHTYSTANILASWDNATGAGYYYPLLDVGDVSTNKVDYDITAFRPALFVREYIDKMFTAAGYTWECSLFDTARFKKLIIPYNRKQLTNNTTNLLDVSDADETLDDGASVIMTFGTGTLGLFTTGDNQVFTFAGADPVITSIACFVNILSYSGFPDTITIQLRKNGTAIKTETVTIADTYDLSISSVALTTGDTLEVRISSVIITESVEFSGTLGVDSSVPIAVPIALSDTVYVNGSIPYNILQKDFLSSVIKLFNLYVYEDIYSDKKLFIAPYVDFYDVNVSGVVDWNLKMDRVRERKIRPMSEVNSKIYNFKYKDDSDYYNDLYKKRYNESYGSRIYDSEYEFAIDNTDIELIFSPTPLVGYAGVDKIVSTIFKLSNSIEEKVDFNIRILQTKKITSVAAWDIENATVDIVSNLDYYGYAGHFDDPDIIANDLNFGVTQELFYTDMTGSISTNQFNVYWSPYMAEITNKDSRLLVAYFKLNAKDIHDLDFSKYVYLDGNFWRLNKIVDWNAAYPEVCICELLKVIYKSY